MRVVCLDFDGVICDSAGETGATGWYGAAHFWPTAFPGDPPAAYIETFRRVRPVLETGYESILLARLIRDGVEAATILATFREQTPAICARQKLEPAELITVFGAVRDNWLARDPQSWLDCHRFYRGVPEAVADARGRGDTICIITTKERRFAAALLKRAGLALPASCLFGLEAGDKRHVLLDLGRRPEFAGADFSFVEDRLATLQRVAAVPGLAAVHLGYASWGFCTAAQRSAAAADPRIDVIALEDFSRWIGA